MRPVELVTLGEAMIRLSAPGFARLEQTSTLEVQVGGSEMNTAVTAQRLGLASRFVTRLPETPLGRLVRNKVREQGVDDSGIAWCKGDRVGLYFLEFGASPRPSAVVYDRAGSAIARARADAFDWERLVAGTRAFHTSGITAALGPGTQGCVVEAVAAARRAGCLVSFDLNYRKKLWSPEEARAFIAPLMESVDVLITTEEDIGRVFGIEGEDYAALCEDLVGRFGLKAAVISVRENVSIWRNRWTAIAHDGAKLHETNEYELEIVDRVGGGDALVGGVLYGLIKEDSLKRGLDLGVATSALEQTNPGDLNWSSLEEAERLLKGGGRRIER